MLALLAVILAFLSLAFSITAFIELRSALGSTHSKAYLPSEMIEQMKKTFSPAPPKRGMPDPAKAANSAKESETPGFKEKLAEMNEQLRGETDFDKLF